MENLVVFIIPVGTFFSSNPKLRIISLVNSLVKISIQNRVLRVSRRKNSKIFPSKFHTVVPFIITYHKFLCLRNTIRNSNWNLESYDTKYSRVDQVKLFKGCLPQILLGPLLNTLYHMLVAEVTIINLCPMMTVMNSQNDLRFNKIMFWGWRIISSEKKMKILKWVLIWFIFIRCYRNILTVAVFYALPVAQLVLTYQRVVNTSGDQDICYYNNFCQRPYHLFR